MKDRSPSASSAALEKIVRKASAALHRPNAPYAPPVVSTPFGPLSDNTAKAAEEEEVARKKKPGVPYSPPVLSGPFFMLPAKKRTRAAGGGRKGKASSSSKPAEIHYYPPVDAALMASLHANSTKSGGGGQGRAGAPSSNPVAVVAKGASEDAAAPPPVVVSPRSERKVLVVNASKAAVVAPPPPASVGQVGTRPSKHASKAAVSPPAESSRTGVQVTKRSSQPVAGAKNARRVTVSPPVGSPGSEGQANAGSSRPAAVAGDAGTDETKVAEEAVPKKRKRRSPKGSKKKSPPPKKPKKVDRGIPFEEMRRLMEVYGSTKCLRKRAPPAGSDVAKIDSVKRKFYRWFPDLEERFVKDAGGYWRPKIGHERELRYREDMRRRDGEDLTRKRASCRKRTLANEEAERGTSVGGRKAAPSARPAEIPVRTGPAVVAPLPLPSFDPRATAGRALVSPASSSPADLPSSSAAPCVLDPRGPFGHTPPPTVATPVPPASSSLADLPPPPTALYLPDGKPVPSQVRGTVDVNVDAEVDAVMVEEDGEIVLDFDHDLDLGADPIVADTAPLEGPFLAEGIFGDCDDVGLCETFELGDSSGSETQESSLCGSLYQDSFSGSGSSLGDSLHGHQDSFSGSGSDAQELSLCGSFGRQDSAGSGTEDMLNKSMEEYCEEILASVGDGDGFHLDAGGL